MSKKKELLTEAERWIKREKITEIKSVMELEKHDHGKGSKRVQNKKRLL